VTGAVDLDLAASAEHDVDLLPSVLLVVVLAVVAKFGGKSSTCIPNDSTPSVAPARLNERNTEASIPSMRPIE
jgi:hypothetical protein